MDAKPYTPEEIARTREALRASVEWSHGSIMDNGATCRRVEARWLATVDALQARLAEAERERDEVKAMHARILAWPPQDVLRADNVIAQAAAKIARDNPYWGKSVLDALDTIKKHRAQQDTEIDALRGGEVARGS